MLMMAASKNPCPYGNELFVLTNTVTPLYGATLVITGNGRNLGGDYVWTVTPNVGSLGNFGGEFIYTVPSTPALESVFAPPSTPLFYYNKVMTGSANSSVLIVELNYNTMTPNTFHPLSAGDTIRVIYYGDDLVPGWDESYFYINSNISDCT